MCQKLRIKFYERRKHISSSGARATLILNLDTIWRRLFRFTPRPLCPQGRTPGTYQLNTRFAGPQNMSRLLGKARRFFGPLEIELRPIGSAVHSLVTVPTLLSGRQLHVASSCAFVACTGKTLRFSA
jgi:hypothetical protein